MDNIKCKLYVGEYEKGDFEDILYGIYETKFNRCFDEKYPNLRCETYLRVLGDETSYGLVHVVGLHKQNWNMYFFLIMGFPNATEFMSERLEYGFPRHTGNPLKELDMNLCLNIMIEKDINFFRENSSSKMDLEVAVLEVVASI